MNNLQPGAIAVLLLITIIVSGGIYRLIFRVNKIVRLLTGIVKLLAIECRAITRPSDINKIEEEALRD